MKKESRYAVAFLACLGIFILWIVFQMYVAKGTLIGIIFCGTMVGVWRAIVSGKSEPGGEEGEKTEENPSNADSVENKDYVETD